MEFSSINGVLVGISMLSISAAAYTIFKYRAKNDEGVSLKEEIEHKTKELELLEKAIKTKQSNLKKLELELISTDKQLKEREQDYKHLKYLETQRDNLEKSIEVKLQLESELKAIKESIDVYSPQYDLLNQGFFEEPQYLYETSEQFKVEIKELRNQQKTMILEKEAVVIPDEILVVNDATQTKRILQGQSKMILRAFNIECDVLISSVKPSNFDNTLERIQKAADDLEKTVISFKCGFNSRYVHLKYKECELQYQFTLKREDEREEQRLIKEQMREESRARREYEKALRKAEEDEHMYADAIEKVRKELEISSTDERDKLNAKIKMLQLRLDEAEENKERAKSMAEMTKRGYVYIISNVGSFGEDIYKIGMTRRLEPMDRVKELGDASVPFAFDVHAMVFSDNAPKLEKELHRAFSHNRVNAVNLRKEFFKVNLMSIKEKVLEVTGSEAEFKLTALAEQYYESLKINGINLL